MDASKSQHKFLLLRGEKWQYHRRVPRRFAHVDSRRFVRAALHTKSLEIAILRRDALVEADDAYWQALSEEAASNGTDTPMLNEALLKRYKSAKTRAMAFGFKYRPAQDIVERETVKQLTDRIRHLEQRVGPSGLANRPETEAILGGIKDPGKPAVSVSKAFALYVAKIAFDDQFNKSPQQRYSWEKTKRTSVNYFIDQMGDLDMEAITREIAVKYRDWWMGRMVPDSEGVVHVKPNTANRHIGNMRTLFEAYFKHLGEEDRDNPFRNMYFTAINRSTVKPFENSWVQNKVLLPGMFDGIRLELKVIVFALIETGARLSEIVNLMPEDIHLKAKIPYISIKPRMHRELKTPDSEREIPLVGAALVAMQACPNGFEQYRDKSTLVSANLMKAFRKRNLLPTKDHVINSFRHAFEKRMQEADIDYALRCTLMGHKNTRPAYGDGGSMKYRRDELLKIVHPYSADLFYTD